MKTSRFFLSKNFPSKGRTCGRSFNFFWCAALSLLFLFLSNGCATRSDTLEHPFFDMENVHNSIVRQDNRSAILESEEQTETQGQRPKTKDFSPSVPEHANTASKIEKSSASQGTRERKIEGAGEEDGILLNFDNADIFEVIQVIAGTLNLNYIIDPQVKGVVNIRSGQKIPTHELFTIFKKILHINGLDIRSEGAYDYIYVAKKSASLRVSSPDQISKLTDSPDLVIQILPIAHLAAAEVQKLIEPYLSAQGAIYQLPNQNTLLISDFESNVVDMLIITGKIDISPLSSFHIKMVRVDNAPLFDLRDELVEIFSALSVNRKEYEEVRVLTLERVNSLLLVSANAFQVENGIRWIKELDVVPSQDRDNIYIYNVRNSVASELADLINQLLFEDKPAGSTKKTPAASTTGKTTDKPAAKKSSTPAKSLSSLRFVGEPVVFADDDRNVILIRALPADYSRIVKLLERLDNLPRQVLVEVIVAEVILSEKLSLGVEWALHNNDLKINGSNYTQSFSTLSGVIDSKWAPAFTYEMISSAGDPRALLKTLADESTVSILSSPQILVLNNETAIVNVGDQVPIITSETQTDTTSTSVSYDKTVQYKDTGVILEVTPQINYDGVILLDIKQTVSNALELSEGGIQSVTISSRELKTKLAVKNGQTIMIGGMIKKNETKSETGIPFLKDIPLLGYLFKYESTSIDKTELLVMVTPYVIETDDVLEQYVAEFTKKMAVYRSELYGKSEDKKMD